MNVLILSGSNHGFAASAPVIHEFLSALDDLSVALDDDKDVLASDGLRGFDVLVHGTGFTRGERQEDGTVQQVPELTPAQEEGLFDFVAGGKGLVGIHGTAWCIGGKAVDLLGGHANWHPPGSAFTVSIIDGDHPVTHGVPDFDVEDEIPISHRTTFNLSDGGADFFRFEIDRRRHYIVRSSGETDTWGDLYKLEGDRIRAIAGTGMWADRGNFAIQMDLDPGEYYLRVSPEGRGDTGSYTVQVSTFVE